MTLCSGSQYKLFSVQLLPLPVLFWTLDPCNASYCIAFGEQQQEVSVVCPLNWAWLLRLHSILPWSWGLAGIRGVRLFDRAYTDILQYITFPPWIKKSVSCLNHVQIRSRYKVEGSLPSVRQCQAIYRYIIMHQGFPCISSFSIQKFCLGRFLELPVFIWDFQTSGSAIKLAATLNRIYCVCAELYAVWKCHTGKR